MWAEEEFRAHSQQLPPEQQRAVNRAKTANPGAWLTVIPTELGGNLLSPQEFRDGVALRFGRPLAGLPKYCDGCDKPFTGRHGLECRKGGRIVQRHNEIRDELAYLARKAYGDGKVLTEPRVGGVGEGEKKEDQEEGAERDDKTAGPETVVTPPGLRADVGIRGFFDTQKMVFFDVRVCDPDAETYKTKPIDAVLRRHEKEKESKFKQACRERRIDFVPFVVSVDGVLGRQAFNAAKRLATALSKKWDRPYSETMNFVRVRLAVAMVRAVHFCIRGERRRIVGQRAQVGDGAGMEG